MNVPTDDLLTIPDKDICYMLGKRLNKTSLLTIKGMDDIVDLFRQVHSKNKDEQNNYIIREFHLRNFCQWVVLVNMNKKETLQLPYHQRVEQNKLYNTDGEEIT